VVTLSIIIPTLNEAAHLPATLEAILTTPAIEVIVVDAHSQDETVNLAKAWGATIVLSSPGRAEQMNAGGVIAQGEILLFLHADTLLPESFAQHITQTLAQPDVVAGAFDLKIMGNQLGLRWVEWGVYWRSRWCQLPYGDQAIFLRATTFRELGGFPAMPIMEDWVFVRQLKRLGRVAFAPAHVRTSGRRWQRLGVVKTTLMNQMMVLGYFLGVSPQQLAAWYRQQK